MTDESNGWSVDEMAKNLGKEFRAVTDAAGITSPTPQDDVYDRLREATAERLNRILGHMDTVRQMEDWHREGALNSLGAEAWSGVRYLGGAVDSALGITSAIPGLKGQSAVMWAKEFGDYAGGKLAAAMTGTPDDPARDGVAQVKLYGSGLGELKDMPNVNTEGLKTVGDIGEAAGIVGDLQKAKEGYEHDEGAKMTSGALGAIGGAAKLLEQKEVGGLMSGMGKVIEGHEEMEQGHEMREQAASQWEANDRSFEAARNLPLDAIAREQEAIAQEYQREGRVPAPEDLGGPVFMRQPDGSVAPSDIDTLMQRVSAPDYAPPSPTLAPHEPEEPQRPDRDEQPLMPFGDSPQPHETLPAGFVEPASPELQHHGIDLPNPGPPLADPTFAPPAEVTSFDPPTHGEVPVGDWSASEEAHDLTQAVAMPGSDPGMDSFDWHEAFQQAEQEMESAGATAEDLQEFRSMEGDMMNAAEAATSYDGSFDVGSFEHSFSESAFGEDLSTPFSESLGGTPFGDSSFGDTMEPGGSSHEFPEENTGESEFGASSGTADSDSSDDE